MPASISPDAITWEGVECTLGLMQRLFVLVVFCSALRCLDIKISVTNLHASTCTVKFECFMCTVTDALATHMQTKIEQYVRLKPT